MIVFVSTIDIRPHSSIRELRSRLNDLTQDITELDMNLALLEIPEEDLLDQDPGMKWDVKRYKNLQEELKKTSETLEAESKNLATLGIRIAQETRSDSEDWEELISALRDVRERTAEKYRNVTAKILAKVQLNAVIREFREEENMRIASGLETKELTKPLHAITRCYKGIRHDEDNGLVLISDDDEEYLLADVSTGAKEQAFLAMRIGFASIVMKGLTTFLILDDAFQHSDWPRRTNLVNQILRLVRGGWQVFYFTMDDHIRDLFFKVGKKIGDRFESCELC